MIIPIYQIVPEKGYIAGTAEGIVKVADVPAIRKIFVFDVLTLKWLQTTKSTKNGNYIIMGLDPDKEYLVMVRDYKPDSGEPYKPFAWDYVKPAIDRTVKEQSELWQSWQT